MSSPLFFNYFLLDLFSPVNLSVMWNFGFALGVFLVCQIATGFILSLRYSSSDSFLVVNYIIRETESGSSLRLFHILGGSLIFLFLYFHIFRGAYFSGFKLSGVWGVGVIIFLLLILVAFLGYVLPWAQISFWAATVITNLVTSVPFVGNAVVVAIWGGFSMGGASLIRFYSLHFLLPFVVLAVAAVHIVLLHLPHSTSGLLDKGEGSAFHPFFTWKDFFFFLGWFVVFWVSLWVAPWFLSETDAFLESDPIVTPEHIVPEWYFLPFYAVLRAVPNNLGGFSALILFFLFLWGVGFGRSARSTVFLVFRRSLAWCSLGLWLVLFWVGSKAVVFPFDSAGGLSVAGFGVLGLAYFWFGSLLS